MFAAIQRAAVSCASADRDDVSSAGARRAMSAGENARRRAGPPRSTGRGQRADQPGGEDRDRDPHDLEVLVHVELDRADHDDVRDDEQGDHPGDEEPARRQPAVAAATSARANGSVTSISSSPDGPNTMWPGTKTQAKNTGQAKDLIRIVRFLLLAFTLVLLVRQWQRNRHYRRNYSRSLPSIELEHNRSDHSGGC